MPLIYLAMAFLLGSAVTIALSLIPIYLKNRSASSRLQHTTHNRASDSIRIAIIGAGISGLNTGLSLLDSNLFSPQNIHLYEANDYVGGRMHTRRWSPDNQSSEWCGEFLDSNYYVMLNLTQRFNLTLVDRLNAVNRDVYQTTLYFSGRFYNESQLWLDYQPVGAVMKQQLDLIGEVNYKQGNAYGVFFDNLSVYDWIERYVPNGHQSPLGQYLDSAYYQGFGLDTREQSSLRFLRKIDPYNQPPDGPLSIYGSADERYRVQGGNSLLPSRIAEYLLENNVTIELHHNLTRIVMGTDQKISLTFANGRTLTFDHVVLTAPVSTLRRVDYSQAQFDDLKRRVIQELRYGTNTKSNLQFSKRFWLDKSSNGDTFTDLPFRNSWEASAGQPGDTGLLVFYTAGDEGTSFTPESGFASVSNSSANNSTYGYVQRLLKNVDQVWPNTSTYFTGQAAVSAPWSDPHFLGSYPCYTPGQYSTLHGYERQRQGNIHFAGDYTADEHFAYMEGATVEGHRAALEIIDDYSSKVTTD